MGYCIYNGALAPGKTQGQCQAAGGTWKAEIVPTNQAPTEAGQTWGSLSTAQGGKDALKNLINPRSWMEASENIADINLPKFMGGKNIGSLIDVVNPIGDVANMINNLSDPELRAATWEFVKQNPMKATMAGVIAFVKRKTKKGRKILPKRETLGRLAYGGYMYDKFKTADNPNVEKLKSLILNEKSNAFDPFKKPRPKALRGQELAESQFAKDTRQFNLPPYQMSEAEKKAAMSSGPPTRGGRAKLYKGDDVSHMARYGGTTEQSQMQKAMANMKDPKFWMKSMSDDPNDTRLMRIGQLMSHYGKPTERMRAQAGTPQEKWAENAARRSGTNFAALRAAVPSYNQIKDTVRGNIEEYKDKGFLGSGYFGDDEQDVNNKVASLATAVREKMIQVALTEGRLITIPQALALLKQEKGSDDTNAPPTKDGKGIISRGRDLFSAGQEWFADLQ